MKNAVIGNNKQKANLIVLGAVPRYVSAHLSTSTHFVFPPYFPLSGHVFKYTQDTDMTLVVHNMLLCMRKPLNEKLQITKYELE